MDRTRTACCRILPLLALLLVAHPARAEQLPITRFSVVDGLPHNRVKRIVQDSRGFIWFCTAEGLSRFDGREFLTYDAPRGLPFSSINDLIETSNGEYWLATNGGGVVRFSPAYVSRGAGDESQTGMFTSYSVGNEPSFNRVNVFYQDTSRRLWVGTDGGLFLLEWNDRTVTFVPVPLGLSSDTDRLTQVWAMAEDGDGMLWIGTRFGLLRRAPDGRVRQYRIDARSTTDHVLALMIDGGGRLWLGHNIGLIVFKAGPFDDSRGRAADDNGAALPIRSSARNQKRAPLQPIDLPEAQGDARLLTTADGLAGNNVTAIVKASDGSVWIGARGDGVAEFRDGRFRAYTRAHGLSDTFVQTINEDRGGTIWIGSIDGAMRIARSGFSTYGEPDGVGQITGVLFEKDGFLYAASQGFQISRFDGERFTSVSPRLPPSITGWRANHGILLDRLGEWWVATRDGLYRFPRVTRFEDLGHVPQRASYTRANGLADDDVTLLFEDRRGDIWIGHFAPGDNVLTRWERSTNRFHRYSSQDGLTPFSALTAITESPAGDLWMAFRGGELVRYAEGRFERVLVGGEAQRPIGAMHFERSGRLWLALHAGGGVVRLDMRGNASPVIARYTTADGLSSNNIGCLTQDERGLLYIVGGGFDRLDPATGRVRRYSVADGVMNTECSNALRDSRGLLWFNTAKGLLRVTPRPERAIAPPQIMIGRLQIAGADEQVPGLGASSLGPLTLPPDRNQVQVEFFALTQDLHGAARYQYRLEGGSDTWSPITDQRRITYANLAPGRYRFMVRAIDADGTASDAPASIQFTILAPVWQRWWFLCIAAALGAAVAYSLHRRRVSRVIELERVRTRIATDLHDEVGSGLSQVSVLSEVVARRVGADPLISEPLSNIATLSRDLVDSMNDIVWAINPARDHLADLTHRMRRFASDVLGAIDVELHFEMPDASHDIALGADVRREVWLVFKESINNIVRHARCTRVDVKLHVRHGELELAVVDNGIGFDIEAARRTDGNGLSSMGRRAARIGGTLEILSQKGPGTIVRLRAPAVYRGRRGRR